MTSSSGSDGIKRNISKASSEVSKALNTLGSGKRPPSENIAGTQVAAFLSSQAVVLDTARNNVADASSLVNVFDGALGQITDTIGRLQEIATQSANGTLSDANRSALNQEFTQLQQEVSRQLSSTEFNGIKFGDQVNIEIGANSPQLGISTGDPSQLTSTINSASITSQSAAQSAVDLLGQAANSVSALRGSLGASQSRLEPIGNNLDAQRVEYRKSAAQIEDADVAQTVADSIAAQIRQQTSTSLLNSFGKINAKTVQSLLS